VEYYYGKLWNIIEYGAGLFLNITEDPFPNVPWCWNMMEDLPTFYPNNDPVLQVNMPAPCAMEHLNIFNGLV